MRSPHRLDDRGPSTRTRAGAVNRPASRHVKRRPRRCLRPRTGGQRVHLATHARRAERATNQPVERAGRRSSLLPRRRSAVQGSLNESCAPPTARGPRRRRPIATRRQPGEQGPRQRHSSPLARIAAIVGMTSFLLFRASRSRRLLAAGASVTPSTSPRLLASISHTTMPRSSGCLGPISLRFSMRPPPRCPDALDVLRGALLGPATCGCSRLKLMRFPRDGRPPFRWVALPRRTASQVRVRRGRGLRARSATRSTPSLPTDTIRACSSRSGASRSPTSPETTGLGLSTSTPPSRVPAAEHPAGSAPDSASPAWTLDAAARHRQRTIGSPSCRAGAALALSLSGALADPLRPAILPVQQLPARVAVVRLHQADRPQPSRPGRHRADQRCSRTAVMDAGQGG